VPAFEIDPRCFEVFPHLEVHAFRSLNARAVAPSLHVQALVDRAIVEVNGVGTGADHPAIARWRDAYGAMGAKPSKFHSSIEALLRGVAKGRPIQSAIELVGFYNACSLIEGAPVGAYDVRKLPRGSIALRPCRPGSDRYRPLGGHPESFPLLPRLIVYADGDEMLCWGFNHRDSRVSALDTTSDEVVFFSEAAYAEQADAAARVVERMLARMIEAGGHCSAHFVANRTAPRFDF